MLSGPFIIELYIVSLRSAPFHICPSSNNNVILHTVQVTLFLFKFIFHQKHFCCSAYSLSRGTNWLLHFSCFVFSITPLMQCTMPTASVSFYLHLAVCALAHKEQMSTVHCVFWIHFTVLVFGKGILPPCEQFWED